MGFAVNDIVSCQSEGKVFSPRYVPEQNVDKSPTVAGRQPKRDLMGFQVFNPLGDTIDQGNTLCKFPGKDFI